jgi:endogenous inhibitor of DNA gyrase (YacG/DUF329 family)
MKPANENKPNFVPAPCPVCSKPSVYEYRPFCSTRCANVDLHGWFTDRYAIPAVEAEDEGPDEDE